MKKEIKPAKRIRVKATTMPYLDDEDEKCTTKITKTKKEKHTFTTDKKTKSLEKTRIKPTSSSSISDSKYKELKNLILSLEKRVTLLEKKLKK